MAVQRRVADVVLARVVVRGGDDELAGFGVVVGGGAQVAHVGAVPGLGHRVAAGQGQGGDAAEVAAVVLFRPELRDAAPEEPELHAVLDEHAEVSQGEFLEGGHGGGRFPPAPELARVGDRAQPFVGQDPDGGEGALAVLAARHLVRHAHLGVPQHGPHPRTNLGVVALQDRRRLLRGARPGRHPPVHGNHHPLHAGQLAERLRPGQPQRQFQLDQRGEGVSAPRCVPSRH